MKRWTETRRERGDDESEESKKETTRRKPRKENNAHGEERARRTGKKTAQRGTGQAEKRKPIERGLSRLGEVEALQLVLVREVGDVRLGDRAGLHVNEPERLRERESVTVTSLRGKVLLLIEPLNRLS